MPFKLRWVVVAELRQHSAAPTEEVGMQLQRHGSLCMVSTKNVKVEESVDVVNVLFLSLNDTAVVILFPNKIIRKNHVIRD